MSQECGKTGWQEFADARGIDAKYEEAKAEADRELRDATAGPDDALQIAPDGTELKNPDGEFQWPSPMPRNGGGQN